MDPAAKDAIQAAKNVVDRVVLHDLMVAICLQAEDPITEAIRRKTINLSALDQVTDEFAGNELFNHAALHEMETFWAGVVSEIQVRSQAS